jgi:hypothetical protein
MSRNFLKASLAGLFVVIAAETGSQVDAASTQAAICKYPGVAACRYVCVLFPNGSSCYPNHTSRQNNSCPSVILNGSEWKANSFGFVRRKKRGDWSGMSLRRRSGRWHNITVSRFRHELYAYAATE